MPFFNRRCGKAIRPFLLLPLLLLALASCAQASPKLQMAPLNPAFLEYVEQLERRGVGEGEAGGLRPSPIDWARIGEAKVGESFWQNSRAAGALPASFDLVAEGRVTPVLSQGMWGTCWSFASTEAVESSLVSEGRGTYNLSELHLAYYAYVDESADKPAFTANPKPGENPIFDNGGWTLQAAALYARGTGPVSETEAPYPTDWPRDDSNWATYLPDPAPSGKTAFRMKEMLRFATTDDIKRAVVEIGGLYCSVNGDGKYRDDAKGTIYAPKPVNTNHAVMLVGWDDDYPKESFVRSGDNSIDVMPAADGAWKIQNSWGEEAGDHGYYWVSYEDGALISNEIGSFGYRMDTADSHDGIYSHDPLGACNYAYIGDPNLDEFATDDPRADMANVFTARRDERIVSVNFVTLNSDIDYEIQIYKDLKGATPDTGTPAWSAPQKGTIAASGYTTVKLDNPVVIPNGERFAVCVTLIGGGEDLYIPAEVAIPRYSEKATASPGESFIRTDEDGWEDTAMADDPFNLCVKAYTVATGASETGGSGGSSGCATGVAGAALLALAFVVVKRRRI